MKKMLLVCLAFALAGSQMFAQSGNAVGLSAERLRRLDNLLDQYASQNRIAGAVALVLRDGKPAYERAVGWSDKEAGRKMTTDTIFRIASQTKALTSTAILILFEEGKLALNEPVGHFIPTFTKTTVAVKEEPGKTVPAIRPITIQDLLTHTAGISYGRESYVAGPNPLARYGSST